jgi:hypothetical protein
MWPMMPKEFQRSAKIKRQPPEQLSEQRVDCSEKVLTRLETVHETPKTQPELWLEREEGSDRTREDR